MAFHTRTQSKDITSNAAHATPLPTYYSQQLPRWTSKSAFEDQKAFEVKAEPFVPIYPQFPAPMPRFDDIPLPPRPERQRLPRKAILIPWILAAVFLFMTLWFASIALGVRLFMVLQPGPTNPPVQEIRIVINEDMLRGSAAAYTTFVTLTSSTTPSTAVASASTLPRDESAVPTTTGHLDTAATSTDRLEVFTTEAPVPRDIKMRPTGFITIARMM